MEAAEPGTGGALPARAKMAAAAAAQHAAAVDMEARFPAESFAAIKAQRLLGIMVPTELGGEGATISRVGDVCYQLGQVCASTAMIFAMHQIKTACIVRHRRANRTLEHLLRRLCAEQLLLASSTTEGQGGGNVRSSEAAVEYQGDRISLERRASVISYGAYADGIVTTARRSTDAAGTDQVLVAFLKSDYTLTRLQGWDTMGMRGTCSEGYVLKATGTLEQIVPDPYMSDDSSPDHRCPRPTSYGSSRVGRDRRRCHDSRLQADLFASGGAPPGRRFLFSCRPAHRQFTKVLSSLVDPACTAG